ncbi:MAG TPA: ABC transporter permease [Vicinamibacterales bacterium]|nr:ABC transporter permease [Vicinamibacterales bacterium]
MNVFDSLRSRFAALLHRSRPSAEIDEELRSHIQHRADDLERSGLARADAERRARIEFGGFERLREETREAAGGAMLDSILQDLRYALRVLRRAPSFTIVAVATLALGIGANAVVFGALNALVLRPLDVPDSQSLYALQRQRGRDASLSYPDYLEIRDRNRSFDGLAAFDVELVALDTGDNPTRAWDYEVTGNYFDMLGIQPHLGRLFHASDEHGPASAPYVVLSYAYWSSHFLGDPGAVGRTIHLNKQPFTIVGVAPAEFHGTFLAFSPDFYVPLVNHDQLTGTSELNDRTKRLVFMTLGHLKPGVAPSQAIEDLNAIGADLEKTFPEDAGLMTFGLMRPTLYLLGDPVRAFMTALMVLAALILLAACANLGSLFAARAADRAREIALRLALGAGRLRILRQLFTEAALISVVGGVLGVWASVLLLRSVARWQPFPRMPITVPVAPDALVYAIALLLTLASALLFGVVPVRQVLRTNPYAVVKSGSTGRMSRRLAMRDLLIGVQIAICAVLVTSSFVAVRGLVRSLHAGFGFEPQNVTLVETALEMSGYHGDDIPAMQRRMIDAMRSIPGVTSVGLIGQFFPLGLGWEVAAVFTDETTDLQPSNAAASAAMYGISPEYFQAAGTTVLAGRSFTWHDDERSPRVAVVNQEFARRLFGSPARALGAYFKRRDGSRVQVVGLVEDGKYLNLAEDPRPAMFLPILQAPASATELVVRSSGDPALLTGPIRDTLRTLDPALPAFAQPWPKALDSALFPSRVATVALGLLGAMGAMLSVTGIFGLAAYAVSKRLREIGIRIALGARRREVLRAALGRAVTLLAYGSVAGLVLGLLATRVLGVIVYQASPRDPVVLSGAVLAMAALGLLATWIPAQRALSADPLRLLREE